MRNNELYNWDCSEFTTVTELQKYIDEIKPILIGEEVKQLLVQCPDYEKKKNSLFGYDLLKENENATIDLIYGPCILKIENHTFCFDMYGGSHIFLSLDKRLEILDKELMEYTDASALYSKNIIGQRIKDIKITRAANEDDFGINWCYDEDIGDDMFKDLIIEFENGHSLNIYISFDYTGIFES